MTHPEFPKTVSGLEVNEAPDGLVVYDPRTNKVHYLNPSASSVFVLATGEHSLADIAAELQNVFELSAPPEDEVRACLADLVRLDLLA